MSKRKLTDDQVHEICKLIEEGGRNKEIAKKYNISSPTVSDIRYGRSFTSITKNYNLESLRCIDLTDEQVHEICKLMEEGVSNTEIVKKYNISPSTVSEIRRGKTHKAIRKKYNITTNAVQKPNSIETIHKICKLLEEGYRTKEIAIDCKVSKQIVSDIRNGLIHIDISKKYNIERNFRKRRLDDETIHKICTLIDGGYSYKDILRITNASTSIVSAIKNSERYSDIACNYNFYKNKKNTL